MFVKICGITTVDDAKAAADAGVDAIGLNFVPGSPRRVDVARAREISDAVRGRVELFAVIADLDDDDIELLVDAAGVETVQLHGDEPPEQLARLANRLQRRVVKAVRLADAAGNEARRAAEVARALAYPGDLLVDASAPGALGGTGRVADWAAAAELATARRVILAGGLTPDNVAAAIVRVKPFGVDVASGVELAPGQKDADRVRRFVERARAASP